MQQVADKVVNVYGVPDFEQFKKDMGSMGIIVMADGTAFSGTMQQIADKIIADVLPTLPRPVKQKRPEQVTKQEGSPVKTVRFEEPEEREDALKSPDFACPKDITEEMHMVMEFNKDFTDVTDVTEEAVKEQSTWENPVLVVNEDDSDDGKKFTF